MLFFSGNLKFENRDKSKLIAFLENLDHQVIDTWLRMFSFLIKCSSTSVKFLIQDLMEEIKPLVAEKRVRMTRCIITDCTFRKFQTFRIMTETTKSPMFKWPTLVFSHGFSVRPRSNK